MMTWYGSLKGRVRQREALKKHTTFKIGGPVEFFIEPQDLQDLRLLLSLVRKNKIDFRVIGAGSNILVSDNGLRGIILKLSSDYFTKTSFNKELVSVGAGKSLGKLILDCRKKGLSGLEPLAGIPGMVGGALVMNAGVRGLSIGDLVKEVTVMDKNGRVKNLAGKKLEFAYRKSNLEKYIVLGASFKLVREDKVRINQNVKKALKHRRLTQDYTYPSAGCIFKNPPGDSAGRLIDSCGLKGKLINGAGVSRTHANFILNLNKASSSDVLGLMGLIIGRVKVKSHITLKPEIKIWQ